RIVGERRAGADQHSVVVRAQQVRLRPRLLAGDPLAVPAGGGDAAVERGGELQRDHRPAFGHPQEEAEVDLRRRLPTDAGRYFDAGLAQARDAAAGDTWIRVLYGDDGAPD